MIDKVKLSAKAMEQFSHASVQLEQIGDYKEGFPGIESNLYVVSGINQMS